MSVLKADAQAQEAANMDFNEYVAETRKTVIYPNDTVAAAMHYLAPALLLEALELHNAPMADVPKEAGDCVWMCTRILDTLGLSRGHDLTNIRALRGSTMRVLELSVFICDDWTKCYRDNSDPLSVFDVAITGGTIDTIFAHVAGIAALYNMTLSDIMQANVGKLADRKARGVLSGSGDHR